MSTATTSSAAGAASVAALAVVEKETQPTCVCPVDLQQVFSKGTLGGTAVVLSALVTSLHEDATPITARKVTLLTHLAVRLQSGAMEHMSSRATETLCALVGTHSGTVSDDVIDAVDAAIAFCESLGGPSANELKRAMLAALSPLCPASPRALCAYMVHAGTCEPEMLALAVKFCHITLVDSHQPVTGFVLRMVDASLKKACLANNIGHKASFVDIVGALGSSAVSLEWLWLYATFLATANDMVKFADPKTALQLTISVPVSSHSGPLQQCVRVMDAVRALQPTGSLDEDLALMAVAWLDVKVVQNSFVYVTVADSAARLVSCLAGCSEKVARAVTASANIMAFMKRAATDGPRLFLFEKLVFWWAQVQWQITNQPTAKRVLDVKSAFEADGLSFRAVKAPAPFLLDVPAVVKFVSERLTTRLCSGCTFARTITNILRMVFQVAPEFILKDPAAHLCVIENAELLPEVCAAIIAAGPVPAAAGPVPTGTGTAAAAAAMRGTPAFVVGAKVTAKYRGRGKWFLGKIVRVEGTGAGALYDVLYDDGDKDDRLREEFVKLQQGARSPAFAVGDKVTVQSGHSGEILKIECANGGVFYIVQLDKDVVRVREEHVKAQGAGTGAGAAVAAMRDTPAFAVGDKVTIHSGRPGKIANVAGFPDGDVLYDVQLDGDDMYFFVREKYVKAREAGTGAGAAVAAMRGTPAFAVGDKVTAHFKGKWHPGKIVRVEGTLASVNLYDILIDNGGGRFNDHREEFVKLQEGGHAGGAGAPAGADVDVDMEMVD